MKDLGRVNVRATLMAQIKRLQKTRAMLQLDIEERSQGGRQLQSLVDELYERLTLDPEPVDKVAVPAFDGISFVVAAYDMERQLRRTLRSLTPSYQGAATQEIEVIVIDNGSTRPLSREALSEFPNVTKVLRVEGRPSPVFGLNQGIEAASFRNVALMIDGAHMLSPGVFANAKAVLQIMKRPLISIPQYLLGDVSQNLRRGGDAFEREEARLNALGWPENGYALFDYAVMAGEAIAKDHHGAIESNCLITTKEVLQECGAFDERFDEPGAGLANIDIYARLRHLPENHYVVIPGEGTFHQDHCGTTTGARLSDRQKLVAAYLDTYASVHGTEAVLKARSPFFFGSVPSDSSAVPTISHDYGIARESILGQLADIYRQRDEAGQTGPVPTLSIDPRATEHDLRTTLPALDWLDEKAGANGVTAADMQYRSALVAVHREVAPNLYLEIGVDRGDSLAISQCYSIGIDPTFEISASVGAPSRLYRLASDVFFENQELCRNLFRKGVDLAFIDGMHLAEYVVRDFINVEKWANDRGVIMIDDVYPEQLEMAERERRFIAWCGDVYKILLILKEYRPDLELHVFEAFVGPYRKGLAVITGLDPRNTVLQENYDAIEAAILRDTYHLSSIAELEERVPPTPMSKLTQILAARP